jgi:hypothetical protein
VQKKRKILRIEWLDSCEWGGWRDTIDDMKPCPCTTVGYLLKETKAHVILAGSASGTSHCSHMVIPRGCIIKITEMQDV